MTDTMESIQQPSDSDKLPKFSVSEGTGSRNISDRIIPWLVIPARISGFCGCPKGWNWKQSGFRIWLVLPSHSLVVNSVLPTTKLGLFLLPVSLSRRISAVGRCGRVSVLIPLYRASTKTRKSSLEFWFYLLYNPRYFYFRFPMISQISTVGWRRTDSIPIPL